MACWNFWSKDEKTIENKSKFPVLDSKVKKQFSMNLDIDGVQLVSGEYRTITRLNGRNFISVVIHHDREEKIKLYENLTGKKITDENIHQFGKTLITIEQNIDLEIKKILEKKRVIIIFE